MKYNNTVCVCMYKVPRSYKISVYINAGIHYVLIYTFNVILGKCWCHSALACWTKGRNRRDDKSCRWKGMFVFPCTFFKSRACPPPPKSPKTSFYIFSGKHLFRAGEKIFGPPYNCVVTMASHSLKSWLRHCSSKTPPISGMYCIVLSQSTHC